LYVVVEDCVVKSMLIEVVRRDDEDAEKQKQQQAKAGDETAPEFSDPPDARLFVFPFEILGAT
jgi:hypothetical protein